MKNSDTQKFIAFNGETRELFRNPEGHWQDVFGTLYGYAEIGSSTDPVSRCGVGFFSLPLDDPRNAACGAHDFMYSSPTFQAFNRRAEADYMLRQSLQLINAEDTVTPELYYYLSRELGLHFWENEETNN